jgi:hypothetical protein
MEPEDSLPCPQESATGPYPVPEGCSSILIFTYLSISKSPKWCRPVVFPTNILYAFFYFPHVKYVPILDPYLYISVMFSWQ